MNSDIEDPMPKKWTRKEQKILVRKTEEQLELEAKDKSQTIPWPEHWENIAACLKRHGYKRTSDACRDKWKRIIESQETDVEDSAQGSDDSLTDKDKAASVAAKTDDSFSNKRNIGSEEGPPQTLKKMRTADMPGKVAVEGNHNQTSLERPSEMLQLTPQRPSANECGDTGYIPNTDSEVQPNGHRMAISSLVAPDPRNSRHNDSQQGGHEVDRQAWGYNLANSQRPVTPPVTPRNSIAGDNEQKSWALKQMQHIQAEIQSLQGDNAQRTKNVALIEKSMGMLKEERDKCHQTVDQAIDKRLREIKDEHNRNLEVLKCELIELTKSKVAALEEEYNGKLEKQVSLREEKTRDLDTLNSKLEVLAKTKQSQLEGLKGNEIEISRQTTGLNCFKGIINYLDAEGNGGI